MTMWGTGMPEVTVHWGMDPHPKSSIKCRCLWVTKLTGHS